MSSWSVDEEGLRSGRVNVGVAEYCVTDHDVELATSGLGSCLAVALYDRGEAVAGLGHFMLPEMPDGSDGEDAKYVDTGIDRMLTDMERRGATGNDVVAKLAGGGTLLSGTAGDDPIGPQNVEAAKRIFEERGLEVVAEDVGADYGRSIRFDAATGDLVVVGAHTETIRL